MVTMRDPYLREAPRGPRALIDAPRGPGSSTGGGPFYGPAGPRGRGFAPRGEYRGRGYRGFRGNRESYYARGDRDRDREWDRDGGRRPPVPSRGSRESDDWSREGDGESNRRWSGPGPRSASSTYSERSAHVTGRRGREDEPWTSDGRSRESHAYERDRHDNERDRHEGPSARPYENRRTEDRNERTGDDELPPWRNAASERRRMEEAKEREREAQEYKRRRQLELDGHRNMEGSPRNAALNEISANPTSTTGAPRRSSVASTADGTMGRRGSSGTAPESIRSGFRDQQESEQISSRQQGSSHRNERRESPPPPAYGSWDYRSPSIAGRSNNPWAERRPERDETLSPQGTRSIGGREDAEGEHRSSLYHSRSTPLLSERDGAPHGSQSGAYGFNHSSEQRSARQEYPSGRYDQTRTRSGSNEGPNRHQHFHAASARGQIPTGPRADRSADRGGRPKNNQWVRPGLSYPAGRGTYGPGPSPIHRDDVDPERSRYPSTRWGREDSGSSVHEGGLRRFESAWSSSERLQLHVDETGSPIKTDFNAQDGTPTEMSFPDRQDAGPEEDQENMPVEGAARQNSERPSSKRSVAEDGEEGDRKRARQLNETTVTSDGEEEKQEADVFLYICRR